ncbi:MAG: ACT domain-containing protein [Actinomycetota bacterium]|nr:ACT domain-containing protein [Actinomycetota bacterium]
MAFLMRVELPDVPGSLGALASAIGAAGGNIEAIEIVEHRRDGVAVDDVLLDMPPTVMPDTVVSACHRLDGVRVVWISRYAAGASLRMDLEAVESLTSDPGSARERLVELVPVTFRCDWALGLRRTPGGVVVTASTDTAPDVPVDAEQWVGLRSAQHLPSVPGWDSTVLAAVPVGGPEDSVVFGRRGGPEILSSELARLAHLAALAVSISDAAR